MGLALMTIPDAMRFEDLASATGQMIYGIEGFRVSGDKTFPLMTWIADYSSLVGTPGGLAASHVRAITFLRNLAHDETGEDIRVEVVVAPFGS